MATSEHSDGRDARSSMEPAFEVGRVGDHLVLSCPGRIDLSRRAYFVRHLWELSVATDASVVVDLTHTSYLDSQAVAALSTLAGLLEDGRVLTVVCPPGEVRQVLALNDFATTHLVVDRLV